MTKPVEVPQDLWDDIITSLEQDVTQEYKTILMARLRAHFDGTDDDS